MYIGDTLWAGNVEIHLNASDWQKHRHHLDRAYDNVILHVVLSADQPVFRTDNSRIPALEIRFDQALYTGYRNLTGSRNWIPCQHNLKRIESWLFHSWLSSLMVERLQDKTERIDQLLAIYRQNWEDVFYIQIARNFGFHVNADPFEFLARSLPLQFLWWHKRNLIQLEALLFGQAGMLNGGMTDAYQASLKSEYDHLRNKYNLRPMEMHQWKFMRLRPVNFPTIRIAQFAALIHNSAGLFRNIIETREPDGLRDLLMVQTSAYWETHFQFGQVSRKSTKTLGHEAFLTILINTVIPMIFHYGQKRGDEKLKARALKWISLLPAEKNTLIRQWEKAGIRVETAFDSQALLQLRSAYCHKKRCLHCMVGNKIITSALS
jgi:hypothetical protein